MGILDREITGSGISRVGVSGVNFRDPTKSLVDTIAGMQDRELREQALAQRQGNQDRSFKLQEANAKRLQAEYERTNTLRNASSVVGEMNPLENTNTALINDMAARQAKLDSMNLPSLGIEAGETTPVFSERDLRSPKVFEDRMKNTLLSQGLTHAEIAPIVEQRMQEEYPITSAEARAAATKTQDEKLKIMSKLYTGKSGSNNVTINGVGGSGTTGKDVTSFATDPRLLKDTIEGITSSQSIFGRAANALGMDKVATRKVVNNLASKIKAKAKMQGVILDDVAVAGILPQLVSSADDNWLRGATLDSNNVDALAQKGVEQAILEGRTSKGNRTTVKTGTSGGASQQANEDALRQLFLEDTKAREAILNSGLRGDTIFSDRVNDINPNTGNDNRSFARQLEEATKANQKPKGGTGKDTKKSIFKTDSTSTGSTDDKEVAVVSDAVNEDTTGHEYGVDFKADVEQLTNSTGKGAGVVGGIISTMFDYANEASVAADNYFDSEDKTRTPGKKGSTVENLIGNAATSFLSLFDGYTPENRAPVQYEDDVPIEDNTLKEELVKHTDSLHTKEGQTKAVEDALSMVTGSSGVSAKMMKPAIESKFVTKHVADTLAEGLKASKSSVKKFTSDAMSDAARKLTNKIFSKRETSGKGVFYKGMGSTSHFPQNLANEVGTILSKGSSRSAQDTRRLREILNEYPTLHAKIKQYL